MSGVIISIWKSGLHTVRREAVETNAVRTVRLTPEVLHALIESGELRIDSFVLVDGTDDGGDGFLSLAEIRELLKGEEVIDYRYIWNDSDREVS